MPAQRLPMRQVREVLRLKHAAGLSKRGIAASLGISRTTVAEYLRRAAVVGITWPVPDELDDVALERRLFSPPFAVHESPRPQPDWARLHAELRRPGVTLLLLWRSIEPGDRRGMATALTPEATRRCWTLPRRSPESRGRHCQM